MPRDKRIARVPQKANGYRHSTAFRKMSARRAILATKNGSSPKAQQKTDLRVAIRQTMPNIMASLAGVNNSRNRQPTHAETSSSA